MTKTWTAPKLNKLGSIADVAGGLNVNANGSSPNLKS